MISSQMPSCVRSFALPVAYAISQERNAVELLQVLGADLPTLMWKWIEFTPKFTSEAGQVSYMGLAAVLRATRGNNELAAVRVKKGGEYSTSADTVLLQTKLVKCFAEFIEVKANEPTGNMDYGDYGDDDDPYGEDIEDDDDEAFEEAIKASRDDFGDVDALDNDSFEGESESPNKEEAQLLEGVLLAPQEGMSSRETFADFLKSEVRQVGTQTIKMILNQDPSLFSAQQKEAVLNAFN